MFIKKLQLKNFKRFTDLTIDLLPSSPLESGSLDNNQQAPKLVLLIGANGCGKSCVFDAFEFLNKCQGKINAYPNSYGEEQKKYYRKDPSEETHFFGERIEVDFSNGLSIKADSKTLGGTAFTAFKNNTSKNPEDFMLSPNDYRFYGRSSFRYTPRITKTSIGTSQKEISQDVDRPKTYIDLDTSRMDADIDQIFRDFFKEIKEKNNAQEKFNTAFNNAFSNIFGDTETSLKYEDFDSPLDGEPVRFWFRKGSSRIHYDYLSAGEKMVFDLLLNLYARRNFFQDSVYFFDEIDLHLNTSLQFDLLKEIVEHWIPENSQVWVASHSLGFIDYARQSDNAAIIDFDNLNFDEKKELVPEKKTLDCYEIAVPKGLIQDLFRGKQIIVCENQDDATFNSMLLSEKLFVGVHDKNAVLIEVKNNPKYFGLRDRDYLTDNEITKAQTKYKNLFILKFYCIENYLYHPENLLELNLEGFNSNEYKLEINQQKNNQKEEIKIQHLKDDRKSDLLIRDENIRDHNYAKFIGEKLDSDQFEDFYSFFNMKKYFKKDCLEKYQENISLNRLSRTDWFKEQIAKLLSNK
ncbi:MAG: AAA family ATPase [Candidatus Melainabacteria bacterium]|jgi:AAA15 family ATPase/GTPase